MFTGKYAFNHCMGTNCDMYHSLSTELTQPEQLLHHLFLEADYSVAYAGKWHVGTNKGPGDFGFEGMSLPGYGNITAQDFYLDYLKDNNLSYTIDSQIYANPDQQTLLGGHWNGPVESTPPHYLTGYTMDKIAELSRRDKPFFMTCQFWRSHGPHLPSDEFYGLHDRSAIEPWINWDDELKGKPSRISRESNSFYRNHPRTWDECRELVGLYYDSTAMIDFEIGRLLDFLEDNGLKDNTIVVLSCDHGDMTGSHVGQLDKGMLYEEAQHIPMIISWPGQLEPSICDDKWKYIFTPGDIDEVYDLNNDPLRDCVSKFSGIWNTNSGQIDATAMFISVRNPKVESLGREIAEEMNISMTQAILEALEEKKGRSFSPGENHSHFR